MSKWLVRLNNGTQFEGERVLGILDEGLFESKYRVLKSSDFSVGSIVRVGLGGITCRIKMLKKKK